MESLNVGIASAGNRGSGQAGGDVVGAGGRSGKAASAAGDEDRPRGNTRSLRHRRAAAADREGDENVRAADGSTQAVRGDGKTWRDDGDGRLRIARGSISRQWLGRLA